MYTSVFAAVLMLSLIYIYFFRFFFLVRYLRLEKIRAERENEMFPDEMDTPLDQAARVRFQR